MRKHPLSLWLLAFVLAVVFSAPVLARQDLTETFTSSDGTLSFNYAPGWQIADNGVTISIGSNALALDYASSNHAPNPGDFYFGIIPPAALSRMGISSTADPASA